MLPDDTYDVFVIDAEDDATDTGVVRLELTVTSGSHKGDVIAVRASNLQRPSLDLIGLPARLEVVNGVPAVAFD